MGSQKHRDLGSWTGLQHAFAVCTGYAGISRGHADHLITTVKGQVSRQPDPIPAVLHP